MNSKFNNKKFTRRDDLSPSLRFIIACTAWMSHQWGTITQLARQYLISRTFVYMLQHDLENAIPQIFAEQTVCEKIINKRDCYEYILSLRLEAKCGIEAISTIMNRFGYPNNSVGFISQALNNISSFLDNTLSTNQQTIQLVIYASDEIFSTSKPILITVDPVSSAILRIELTDCRNADQWKQHWNCLFENGYYAIYLVSDEGTAMKCAKNELLQDVIHQPDTFHAISHQLGLWVNRLEQAAYSAIHKAYNCYDKLDSAVSDKVINKRIDAYEQAEKTAKKAIKLYDEFHEYYAFLINQLRLFDNEGNLCDRTEAESNIKFALDLIMTLENNNFNKTIKKITKLLPNLLAYFNSATTIVNELKHIGISEDVLKDFCLAWQYRKAKKQQRRNFYKNKESDKLYHLQQTMGEKYAAMVDIVYTKLDTIVQSSALVETINSIVRAYLNTTRNHISQNLLNLIMFYHNHRRYRGGKRKGKTPLEILTGNKQEKDWIQLLFEKVEKKAPTFFLE
jgi:hypothetical protein